MEKQPGNKCPPQLPPQHLVLIMRFWGQVSDKNPTSIPVPQNFQLLSTGTQACWGFFQKYFTRNLPPRVMQHPQRGDDTGGDEPPHPPNLNDGPGDSGVAPESLNKKPSVAARAVASLAELEAVAGVAPHWAPSPQLVKYGRARMSELEEAVRTQIEFSAVDVVDLSPEKDLQHRLEVLALATAGEEMCPMEGRPFQHLQELHNCVEFAAVGGSRTTLPAGGLVASEGLVGGISFEDLTSFIDSSQQRARGRAASSDAVQLLQLRPHFCLSTDNKAIESSHEQELSSRLEDVECCRHKPLFLGLGLDSTTQVYAYTNRGGHLATMGRPAGTNTAQGPQGRAVLVLQRQQQWSCFDPPIINIETVENDTAKQSTRDHDLVTEPSKSIRLALWGLWSGLVRLVGSGLGLALLLASGWFIGLSLEPLHRNSIQQHFIMPSCPSSLGGNALEVQHLTLTMLFIAGGNLSGDANDLPPLQVNKPVALGANNTNGLPSETEIGPWAEDVLPTPINRSDLRTDETPANDDALYIDPSSTSLVDRVSEGDECVVEITTNANNTNELQWEAEDESIQAPKKIEVDDGLPSLSSPFSLRTNTKPTNDDALVMILAQHPEGDDGNFFSSDSDGVYVPEGEVYYTMNGDRLADDDSQLPFGFVKTYGSLALLGFADYLTIYLKNVIVCNRNWLTFPYFCSSLQSADDVKIPSADLQCELSTTEFQVWSKVIRSCDISLEVGADSSQPAIEFSRDRVIERPWDVWLRNFIRFGYQQTKQYPILHVSQLMELRHIGDALSVTISSLLAIESMSDLMRAIIEQEGVTCGLHFAQIQLRLSFFYQLVLQRDDDLPFTINCFQTHLQIATWIPNDVVYGICVGREERKVTVVFQGTVNAHNWKMNLKFGTDEYRNPVKQNYPDREDELSLHSGYAMYLLRKRKDSGVNKLQEIFDKIDEIGREMAPEGNYKLCIT
ncbi:hypothetical protein THAOC_18031, partial [Thalassiosira oceanica]